MLKLLVCLVLALLCFVILFYNRLKEALSPAGMGILVFIIFGLSGTVAWLGYVEKNAGKRPPSVVVQTPVEIQTVAVPGDPPADVVANRGPSEPALSIQEIYEKTSPSVVVVYNLDGTGQVRGHGTGFFIDPWGMVVTNYHVVEGASSLKIKTKSGQTLDVSGVSASDAENDIVILSAVVRDDSVRTLKIAPARYQVGDKIVVIGTPLLPQLSQTVTDGIISAVRTVSSGKRLIQISAPISPGSSGSPVVNVNGEVVGIVSRVLRQSAYIGIAVPGDFLAAMTPSRPVPVSTLPVIYASNRTGAETAPGQDDTQRRLEDERRRALDQQERAMEQKRRWQKQQVAEASDYLDKARHNLSYDRQETAYSQLEKALQIFRGANDAQGMAVCLEQMGAIHQKRGSADTAKEYFRQAAQLRARQ